MVEAGAVAKLEEAAGAIGRTLGGPHDAERLQTAARAAFETLLKPTNDMIVAGLMAGEGVIDPAQLLQCFLAMVIGALDESDAIGTETRSNLAFIQSYRLEELP